MPKTTNSDLMRLLKSEGSNPSSMRQTQDTFLRINLHYFHDDCAAKKPLFGLKRAARHRQAVAVMGFYYFIV
uniref:Uncharacterized protein n=1 Tax=Strigamia maritima TaxID=126957 RepID=T1JED6_STRMM